jgi:hypothetical protein
LISHGSDRFSKGYPDFLKDLFALFNPEPLPHKTC